MTKIILVKSILCSMPENKLFCQLKGKSSFNAQWGKTNLKKVNNFLNKMLG